MPYIDHTDIIARIEQLQGEDESPESADYTLLDELADEACDIVNGELGFEFADWPSGADADNVSDLVVYGTGAPYLKLPAHKLGTVTQVTAEVGCTMFPQGLGTDLVIPRLWWTEDLPLDGSPGGGSLYLRYMQTMYVRPGWSGAQAGWGQERYTVKAVWGYGPVPARIRGVCIELAVNLWREKEKGMYSDVIGVEANGEMRIGYNRALTNRQKMIIESVRQKFYRVPKIGQVNVR